MNRQDTFSSTVRAFIGLAAFGLTLFFLREGSRLVNALLLGFLITVTASPLLHGLTRRRVPAWLAYVITLVAIALVFGLLVVLMIVALNRLALALPEYVEELEQAISAFQSTLAEYGLPRDDVSILLNFRSPDQILDAAFTFLAGLASTLSDVALIGLIVIFLLVDAFTVPSKLNRQIESGNVFVAKLATFSGRLRRYVYITTIVGLVTGVFDTIFFAIIGVDFAILWGIVAFLFSYIPTLGFWLAAIPPTFLALLEFGPLIALVVFLGIVLINGFAENFVKPKYMGEGLDLSPFVVVFSVIFWSAILGPMGAILSIPMTLILKELILEMDPRGQWIADLMASSKPRAPAETPLPDETAATGAQEGS